MIWQIHREIQEMKTPNRENAQSKALVLPPSNEMWIGPSVLGYVFGAIHYSYSKSPRFTSKNLLGSSTAIRVFTPQWIFGKVYEAQKIQDQWNCRFTFRTYNIVPWDCELFLYAKEGNVKGLQQLFGSGEATPFDRGEDDGWTALHVSIHLDFSRLLE
jgi:hypothetical protein